MQGQGVWGREGASHAGARGLSRRRPGGAPARSFSLRGCEEVAVRLSLKPPVRGVSWSGRAPSTAGAPGPLRGWTCLRGPCTRHTAVHIRLPSPACHRTCTSLCPSPELLPSANHASSTCHRTCSSAHPEGHLSPGGRFLPGSVTAYTH